MIRGGLAGGIGAIRLVGVRFLESRVLGRERTIDLIRGDMEEAEVFLICPTQSSPVGASCLKELKGANDVCLDKLAGAVNRAIHMRLGGKVHHGLRFVLGEQAIDESRVTYIASNEDMAWISLKRGEILKVASVG